jgi:hypothetical protein
VASEGGDGFGEAVEQERLQRGGEGGQRRVALSGGAAGVPHLPDRRGRAAPSVAAGAGALVEWQVELCEKG